MSSVSSFGPGDSGTSEDFRPAVPSEADDRWRTAAVRRGVWLYDRAARLTALVERVEDQTEFLGRERCDLARDDHAGMSVIDRRLALLGERLTRLRRSARAARRVARAAEGLEARAEESGALDCLERGFVPADPARSKPVVGFDDFDAMTSRGYV